MSQPTKAIVNMADTPINIAIRNRWGRPLVDWEEAGVMHWFMVTYGWAGVNCGFCEADILIRPASRVMSIFEINSPVPRPG